MIAVCSRDEKVARRRRESGKGAIGSRVDVRSCDPADGSVIDDFSFIEVIVGFRDGPSGVEEDDPDWLENPDEVASKIRGDC